MNPAPPVTRTTFFTVLKRRYYMNFSIHTYIDVLNHTIGLFRSGIPSTRRRRIRFIARYT